ncbi:helix-turn-helix domain-containing protein [Lentzea roselyniae]|uniref:helix-turn-helix domain-containing protein n=1 Tax=Lentzea roselyniae TaxID=531940 RepID=UPI003D157B69
MAHVAKELGVSRQCAHRWVRRFRDEGAASLADRSSRATPHAVADLRRGRTASRGGSRRAALRTGSYQRPHRSPRAHRVTGAVPAWCAAAGRV